MLQVVDLVNKIKEKKDENLKRSFLFNDLINDRCHYDPVASKAVVNSYRLLFI